MSPFMTTRTAATYAKEILKYVSGAEIKDNAVIDGTQIALNSDGRRIVESGQVMIWVGSVGSSKVKPAPNDGSIVAANVAGILETTYEFWPDTPPANKADKPVALFTKNANFATGQLLGYSGNVAAVKAAMTGAGNDVCANCTFRA